MKLRNLWVVFVVLFLAACGTAPQAGECDSHTVWSQESDGSVLLRIYPTNCAPFFPGGATATQSEFITATPLVVTDIPVPTSTAAPTQVPTATAQPSATPTSTGLNLFDNPGFEETYQIYTWNTSYATNLKLPEIAMARGWHPAIKDFPYQAAPSPAMFAGTKNPANLKMGRPEMRETVVTGRYRSGQRAQYWFCQFRVCDGGVYQTVSTVAGQTCTVSVYVQSWSNPVWTDSLGDLNFKSQFPNGDALSNSLWRIMVDTQGNTNNLFNTDQKSAWFSRVDTITEIDGEAITKLNHYDKFVQLTYTFRAASNRATIFFRNLRLFPFTFNDSMVDDANVVCQ